MYTAVILLKRLDTMSREDFLAYYKDRHGPLMARLMHGKGLISYEHFPIEVDTTEGMYLSADRPDFDAVSVYSFESKQACEACWALPEVIEDSQKCMNQQTMITYPTGRRRVYPIEA